MERNLEYITENLRTPVTAECDVLVAGGGIAGIAAALAAARQGTQVLLTEKQYVLGGLATAGLVTIFLPLCDGMGHQVTFGLAEELLRTSIQWGAEAEYPHAWLEDGTKAERSEQRFQVRYNPQLFAIAAERLLRREGVRILYGAAVCGARVVDGRITEAIVEHKSGREAIRLKTAIDATGDADLCRLSGESTALFHAGNVLAAWHYFCADSGYGLKMLGCAEVPPEDRVAPTEPLIDRRFQGIDGWELSEMTELSHEQILKETLRCMRDDPHYIPATMATIPQVRMTRRLDVPFALDTSHDHRDFTDSIGLIGNWKKRGPVYAVPFRVLQGNIVHNLLVAGRCISTTDSMWDVTRVIPACAVTGQAAGTAAALGYDRRKVDIGKLQQVLRKNNVRLHMEEIIP